MDDWVTSSTTDENCPDLHHCRDSLTGISLDSYTAYRLSSSVTYLHCFFRRQYEKVDLSGASDDHLGSVRTNQEKARIRRRWGIKLC